MGLLQKPEGVSFLQSLTDERINAISNDFVKENVFGDVALLKQTVLSIWDNNTIHEFIAHSLWCAHREAMTRATQNTIENIAFDFIGVENLLATNNKPVIVISPMTLCTEDAIKAIMTAIEKFQPNRKFICYGEDMNNFLDRNPACYSFFADDTVSGIRKILEVLKKGGIFFTYPDFVYNTHNSFHGELFGVPRTYSAGLIKIALHSQAILLPTITKHNSEKIEITFFESIQLTLPAKDKDQSKSFHEQILTRVIGKILEALILKVPNQWRLLPTLTHEVEEMA
jgi:lauroyl/myristoyl acyltransferase